MVQSRNKSDDLILYCLEKLDMKNRPRIKYLIVDEYEPCVYVRFLQIIGCTTWHQKTCSRLWGFMSTRAFQPIGRGGMSRERFQDALSSYCRSRKKFIILQGLTISKCIPEIYDFANQLRVLYRFALFSSSLQMVTSLKTQN